MRDRTTGPGFCQSVQEDSQGLDTTVYNHMSLGKGSLMTLIAWDYSSEVRRRVSRSILSEKSQSPPGTDESRIMKS